MFYAICGSVTQCPRPPPPWFQSLPIVSQFKCSKSCSRTTTRKCEIHTHSCPHGATCVLPQVQSLSAHCGHGHQRGPWLALGTPEPTLRVRLLSPRQDLKQTGTLTGNCTFYFERSAPFPHPPKCNCFGENPLAHGGAR